jgi:hypothetical protein
MSENKIRKTKKALKLTYYIVDKDLRRYKMRAGILVPNFKEKKMSKISLSATVEDVLLLGFERKRPKLSKGELTWKGKFDLRGWGGRENEFVVLKNDITNQGKVQEVEVRIIFKKGTGLGYNTLAGVIIVFERKMPVGDWKVVPPTTTDFSGNPWKITEIKYFSSPSTVNKIIVLDPFDQ